MAPHKFREPIYIPSQPRGRPRKTGELGHNAGTTNQDSRMNSGIKGRTLAPHTTVLPVDRRLLDLNATAQYLSVSRWTVRDMEAAGVLHRVRLPLADHGELRKILFDRVALDRLIDGWKDG